jgi:hypothetical protein
MVSFRDNEDTINFIIDCYYVFLRDKFGIWLWLERFL